MNDRVDTAGASVLLVVRGGREQRVRFPAAVPMGETTASAGDAAGDRVTLDLDEGGRPFVSAPAGAQVSLNGEPLVQAQWLHAGDVLAAGGEALVFAAPSPGLFSLTARGTGDGDAADATLPPGAEALDALAASAGGGAGPSPASPADVGALDAAGAGTGDAVGGSALGADSIAPADYSRARGTVRRRRRLPWQVPALVVAALFAVGLWFVFTARSVEIEVVPTPDSLTVTGPPWKVSAGGARLMRPGEYHVRATRAGYHPLDATFMVDERAAQTHRFELTRLPGEVVVTTEPAASVEVIVDGEPRGTTPFAEPLILEAGVHTFEFRAPRYQSSSAELDVEGLGQRQALSVALAPDWAEVEIATQPAGAEIRVDGELMGTTPATLELLSGTREIALKLAGHKRYTQTIQVDAGEPRKLTDIRLAAADGLVTLRSQPAGALVTVNGHFRGQTPLELELTPGQRHAVTFTKAGYERSSVTLTVESGQERNVDVTLEAVTGTVLVRVDPPQAEVLVGGRVIGRGEQRVELPAVRQRIEARAEGYAPASAEVTPQPGFEQEVKLALLTQAQAAYAAIPKNPVVTGGIELKFVDPERAAGDGAGVLRFEMGSSRRDPDRLANEVQYEVELRRPFYVSTTEITNAQFRRFRPGHRSGTLGQYSLDGATQPVVRVTWQDAAAFCNWLSAEEGLPPAYVEKDGELVAASPMTTGYRLPTEAEWSWVARFGGEREPLKFPWGERLPPPENSGNYAGAEARPVVGAQLRTYEDQFVVSAPVGSYPPARLGLYDIGGNVAEWVHDYFGINVDPGPLVDPLGPSFGRQRVIRGASYLHGRATELRLTFRDFDDRAREDVGFRVGRYYE